MLVIMTGNNRYTVYNNFYSYISMIVIVIYPNETYEYHYVFYRLLSNVIHINNWWKHFISGICAKNIIEVIGYCMEEN